MKKLFVTNLVIILAAALLLFGCDTDSGDSGDPAEGLANPVDLALPPPITNGLTQQGWGSDGVDDIATGLDVEDMKNAATLVLELENAAALVGSMDFVWLGAPGWTWRETKSILDSGNPVPSKGTTINGNTLTIELSKALTNYAAYTEATELKVMLCYYSTNIASLGITRAYLK